MHDQRDMPDGLIGVFAYLLLLSVASFFGGVTILANAVPAVLAMGPAYSGGVVVTVLTGSLPLLLGLAMLAAMWQLWRRAASGRVITLILAVMLLVIAAFGTFYVILEEFGGSFLYGYLLGAIALLISSILVLRYLMLPRIKAYFGV
jgi:hypothetical protein